MQQFSQGVCASISSCLSVELQRCLTLFITSCSTKHAVHQGYIHSEGEGGYFAHPHLPHRGPELRVLCQVLYPEPDSRGHGGLCREEKCGGVSHHFLERGEGELSLAYRENEETLIEEVQISSLPLHSLSEGAHRGCPNWFHRCLKSQILLVLEIRHDFGRVVCFMIKLVKT